MTLTAAQLTALKTDIQGNSDQTIINALAAGDNGAIATWYNQVASPDYHVYEPTVSSDSIRDAINANDIANITDADRGRAVDLLAIRADRGFNGADADDRAAWDDIFSTVAGDKSQQAILALWTRLANRVEKVLSTNTGTGADVANADTLDFAGTITYQEVGAALTS